MVYLDVTDNDDYIAVQKPDLYYYYFYWSLGTSLEKAVSPLKEYKDIYPIGPTNLGFWSEE